MLLAIDPGTNSPGMAIFTTTDDGAPFDPNVLVGARRILLPESDRDLDDGARWLKIATEITGWAVKYIGGRRQVDIVFEKPRWLQHGKSKGDPNQLAGLAGVSAAVCGRMSMLHPGRIFSPTPDEWIGQVPKVCPFCHGKAKKKCKECRGSAWETPRGKRIRSRLSPAELLLVPDQNDAIDAVGIGLWKLGRLQPHSVFSNGRDGR